MLDFVKCSSASMKIDAEIDKFVDKINYIDFQM